MFSGIVESRGEIVEFSKLQTPFRLRVETGLDLSETKLGDSIAIDGVCLTVVDCSGGSVSFDVVQETIRCSTLSLLNVGSKVNVERSLRLGDRVHGHLVFGHVDTKVRFISRVPQGVQSVKCIFQAPPEILPYIVKKGSIALSGVSLTVGEVDQGTFTCYLVPHTLEVTTLGQIALGTMVNVEIDMLARYAVGSTRPTVAEGSTVWV